MGPDDIGARGESSDQKGGLIDVQEWHYALAQGGAVVDPEGEGLVVRSSIRSPHWEEQEKDSGRRLRPASAGANSWHLPFRPHPPLQHQAALSRRPIQQAGYRGHEHINSPPPIYYVCPLSFLHDPPSSCSWYWLANACQPRQRYGGPRALRLLLAGITMTGWLSSGSEGPPSLSPVSTATQAPQVFMTSPNDILEPNDTDAEYKYGVMWVADLGPLQRRYLILKFSNQYGVGAGITMVRAELRKHRKLCLLQHISGGRLMSR
ncbi:hypothetical protein BDZ91DRAFT_758321 [Kalaharituber pfeilii]|nr:hypothetical protein BDZ91DRAFT_758321 [Kalaharituber pfeilii]